jgi:peroxiredoxin family protein
VNTTKKTIIVFSGDLDKLLAAFVIANGAAAMGDDVTMFFTFWGLNALRKEGVGGSGEGKSTVQKMFAKMLPKTPSDAGISRMNMGGMGSRLMKKVMREQNVDSIEQMRQTAIEQEITMIACTMSMDVMGFSKEDLIDGIDYAGVATYLGEADEANVNLFI